VERADVVVIGLGAMGSATLYQLAKRGVDVVGIDRFSPPHTLGSSHGDTRVTRQAIGEGAAYVPLVLRSHELWREIESETGTDLFTACGGLVLSAGSAKDGHHGIDDFFASTVAVAKSFAIAHEILTPAEVRSRFPQFNVTEEHRGYYEPGAGFVRPERAVAAQLELATRHGARIRRAERVSSIDPTAGGVTIRSDRAEYGADQVVMTAGPWISSLADCEVITSTCKVFRQTMFWFDAAESIAMLTPDRMPVFIWGDFGSGDRDMFYGFPAIDGVHGGLKVATEQYEVSCDPENLQANITPEESQRMFERCVRGRLPLSPAVMKSAGCFYTVTPDHQFILDRHPEHPAVLLASPCSGHGFKHSPAIGESLAQWVTDGKSIIDLSAFALTRFATREVTGT
jgi:sarcosine oxidase